MVSIAGERIIGIDVGTSGCAAAVLEDGRPRLIPSAEGKSFAGKVFPSYVAFAERGEKLVCGPAKERAASKGEGVINAVKREMGTPTKFKEFTPQEIMASILTKVRADAESALGVSVEKVVITVPANFNDNQRSATKDAAELAGLEVVRIINEPTAAGLAYCFENGIEGQKIMVFDLGGGVLDVSIMALGGGAIRVLATAGDMRLGGMDMDASIADYAAGEFESGTGIDLKGNENAMKRLTEAAEAAKIELGSAVETGINVPNIAGEGKHLNVVITGEKLRNLVAPVIERCSGPIKKALKDAGLETRDIDSVLLVGGVTKMPVVRDYIKDFTGIEPKTDIESTQCVAAGAAIQAGILIGMVADIPYLDVLPLEIGIEAGGGKFIPLIERNAAIPAKRAQIFTTAIDNQTSVDIHVLQGEGSMAADNVSLERVQLVDIPPALMGEPQIEVTFDIDVDGLLRVSARDAKTGGKQKIKITAPHKISKGDIKEKIRDAEFQAALLEKDQEIAELMAGANRTKEELHGKSEKVQDVESRLEAATASLAERDEQLSELERRLASRDEQLGELESGLRSTSETIANGGEKLVELEQRIKAEGELKAEIGEKDRKIAELEEKVKMSEGPSPELEEKDKKIEQLESVLLNKDKRLADLEQAMKSEEGLSEKLQEKDGKIDELKNRMKETLDDLVAKEERLIEAESDIDAINESLTKKDEKITELELSLKTNGGLQEVLAEKDERIAGLEETLKEGGDMSQKLAQKDEKIEEMRQNLKIANDNLVSKEERLMQLEASLKATSDNLIKREEKLIDLEKMIKTEDEFLGRLQKKDKRILELELDLKSTADNLVRRESRLMELESSMKTAAESLDKKGEELQELEKNASKVEGLEADLAKAMEDLAKKDERLEEALRGAKAVEGLKSTISQKDSRIGELEGDLRGLEESLTKKEEKLVELGTSLKSTTESLSNREVQLTELGSNLKTTSQHLDRREKQLTQLEQKIEETERDLERKNKALQKDEQELTKQKQKYQKLIKKIEKESQQKHAEYENKIKETDKRVEVLTKEIEKTLGDLKK